ncbi:MAG TPA: Fur family transcriptional regulator [Candidatus Limnocylindria bacterium]
MRGVDSVADRLHAAGERATPQRLLIADALAAHGRRITAQELYERVRRRQRGIGRATVFRTLEALVAAGVARRFEEAGNVSGYVACRPEHHHHLACDRCGRVEEIDEAVVRPLADRAAGEFGFAINDARLDFYGICADCQALESAAAGLGEMDRVGASDSRG